MNNSSPPTSEQDLRSFISHVKENSPKELLHINQTLSADWELAAVTEKLEQKFRAPLLQFNAVENCSYPVVSNVCSSWNRVAKASNISLEQLEQRFKNSYDKPIAPELWQDKAAPPVRDVVLRDAQIDLLKLPQIRYTETETHAYMSAACVVVQDQDSGVLNLSYHRLMIVGATQLAICAGPGGHLNQIIQANNAAKRNTSIAVFIGAHPLWSLASLASGNLELDEYKVIGGLLGYPLPVVSGLLDANLLVPARAEIVLEGEIAAGDTIAEGPYGEAFGFVSDVSEQPLMNVQIFSSRHEPLFQDIVPGKMEHLNMTGFAARLSLERTIFEQFPALHSMNMVGPMTLYLSVKQEYKGCKDLIDWCLKTQRFIKQVVIFSDDIDLRNNKQCQWAMASNVQASRDLIILQDQIGNGLDPSEIDGKTSKWGLDATSKPNGGKLPVKNKIPQSVLDKIDIKKLLEDNRPS